jgi:hypothetical protein
MGSIRFYPRQWVFTFIIRKIGRCTWEENDLSGGDDLAGYLVFDSGIYEVGQWLDCG